MQYTNVTDRHTESFTNCRPETAVYKITTRSINVLLIQKTAVVRSVVLLTVDRKGKSYVDDCVYAILLITHTERHFARRVYAFNELIPFAAVPLCDWLQRCCMARANHPRSAGVGVLLHYTRTLSEEFLDVMMPSFQMTT